MCRPFSRGVADSHAPCSVLSFTVFLMSGTPSSASQSVATMLFCPEGKSPDTLAAFLGAQCEWTWRTPPEEPPSKANRGDILYTSVVLSTDAFLLIGSS